MRSKLLNMLEKESEGNVREVFSQVAEGARYEILKEVMGTFDEGLLHTSEMHGITHVERVCFLGLLLADHLSMTDEDTRLYLTACVFHDIGRNNDRKDDAHGARAAKEVEKYVAYTGDDLRILRTAIEAHSLNDRAMHGVIEAYGVNDEERGLYIAKALKDADALDRVRDGCLDLSYLRYKESLDLSGFAEELFWFYH